MSTNPTARKLLLVLAASLAALLLLVAAAPTLVASGPGQRLVLGMVNERIAGSIAVESLSLGWFSGQHLGGLEVRDAAGTPVVQLAALDTDMTLLQAVLGKLNLGETRISGLTLDLIVDDTGGNNLLDALGGGEASEPGEPGSTPLVIPVTGTMVLERAHITLSAPDLAPVTLDPLNVRIQLDPDTRAFAAVLAATSDYEGERGQLDITADARDWLDTRGQLTLNSARYNVDATLADVPVAALDRLLAQGGVMAAALGDTLTVTVQLREQDFRLNVDSATLAVALNGTLAADMLTLSEPGSLRWQMTPALLHALGEGDDSVTLRAAVPFTLAIDRLRLPLSGNAAEASISAALSAGAAMELQIEDLGALSVTDIAASLDSPRLADSLALEASAAIHGERDRGQLAVQASARELFDDQQQLQPQRARLDGSIDISALPTALIDRLGGGGGLLPALLGPQLAVTGSISSADNANMTLRLGAQSATLETDTIAVDIGQTLRLEEAAELRLRLTPAAFALLAPDSGWRLAQDVPLRLNLEQLRAPRPAAGEPMLQPAATQLALTLAAEPVVLRDAADGEQRISRFTAKLGGDSLAALTLDAGLRVSQDAEGLLTALLGAPLDLTVSGRSGLDEDAGIKASELELALSGGDLNGRIPLHLSAGMGTLRLGGDASLSLPITPSLMARWVAPETLRLRQPATLALALQTLELPLDASAMERLALSGTASLSRLDWEPAGGGSAAVDNLKLNVAVDCAAGESRLDGDARLSGSGTDSGGLTLRSLLAGPPAAPQRATLELNVKQLPPGLLALADQVLAALPGSPLDLDARADITFGEPLRGSASLAVDARHLKGKTALELAQAMTLKEASRWDITLTPESFALLTADPESPATDQSLRLDENAQLSVTLQQLHWPLAEDAGAPRVTAALQSPRIGLRGSSPLLLESVRATLDSSDLQRDVQLALSATTRDGDQAPGTLTLDAQASGFMGDAGLDLTAMAWRADGAAERLPVDFVDGLLESDGLMLATLGRGANARFEAAVSEGRGPVTLNLTGSNARMTVAGELRDGVLTLRQPVTAQLQATAELGSALLGQAHPLFRSLQGGEDPVRLTIPVDGFRLPLQDFALADIRIPELRFEPGVMTLESGPLLDGLIAVANRVGRGAGPTGTGGSRWRAEFTPAVMSLKDGKLAYLRRLDVLLGERMHLATWGSVDLTQSRADLMVSVMPHMLRTVFGIDTQSEQGLNIPLRGNLDGSGVDYSALAVELAKLQAGQRASSQSALLGALAGALSGGGARGSDGGSAPAASVDPLPFAERIAPPHGKPAAGGTGGEGAGSEKESPAEPETRRKSGKEETVRDLLDIIRRGK